MGLFESEAHFEMITVDGESFETETNKNNLR